MSDANALLEAVMYRLKWPLRLTRAGIAAERATRAFWPLWTLALVLVAALAFGAAQALPPRAVRAALGVCGLAFLWLTVQGVRRFRWPTGAEAVARLDSRLPHRPLAALADVQAVGLGDGDSAAIWHAHVARMARRAIAARPVSPDLRLSGQDPFALRYVALTAFVMAVGFGALWRLAGPGALPPVPGEALATGPAWEAWIQPPAYTGKPEIYLNKVTRPALTLPAGSRVIVRLYGTKGAQTVNETVSVRKDADPAALSQSFVIVQSGRLAIDGRGGRDWNISMMADAPPSVRFLGTADRLASGQLRQTFAAQDDYGIVKGHTTITLELGAVDRRYGLSAAPEPHKPIVLDLPLPISGSRRKFEQTLVENLEKHAWANLPVRMVLTVEDAAGHSASTAPKAMDLPGRRFFDPLAAAVIEMRRDLLWARANALRVTEVLRAITDRPEGFFRNHGAYLLLRVTIRRLELEINAGLTTKVRDEVASALWQVAVAIEDGTLSDALQRLQQAQERLSQAIRRGASPDEVQKLMDGLNHAMRNYIRKLAEQQQANPDKQSADNGNSRQITGDRLQQMLNRLQQLMNEGRTAEAQQLLQQLNQLMQNLRVTQGQGGMSNPGQGQMQGLADTLRKQQKLSDRAFRNLQKQGSQAQPGQDGQGGQQGQGTQQQPGSGGKAQALADRQKALNDQLRRQSRQGLPGAGSADGKAGREALDRAGRAMTRAEKALRQGDMAGALDRQAEALDALRQGMRDLDRATAHNQVNRPGQADGTRSTAGNGAGHDPLGRSIGQTGQLGTDLNLLQDEDVYRRTRKLLDELRHRLGDLSRPETERDYLKRLLQPF